MVITFPWNVEGQERDIFRGENDAPQASRRASANKGKDGIPEEVGGTLCAGVRLSLVLPYQD